MKIRILMLAALLFFISGCSDKPDPKDVQIKKLEHQLRQTNEDASRWRTYTAIAGVVSTVIFAIGIGIGSSVRKNSNKQIERSSDA